MEPNASSATAASPILKLRSHDVRRLPASNAPTWEESGHENYLSIMSRIAGGDRLCDCVFGHRRSQRGRAVAVVDAVAAHGHQWDMSAAVADGRPWGRRQSSFDCRAPAASRPSPNRPSMANVSRPGNISRPSGGGFSPSGGGRPNVSRPTTRPGGSAVANRPAVRPPSNVKPVSRPSLPSGGIAGGNRPNLGNVNRPATLPGTSAIVRALVAIGRISET